MKNNLTCKRCLHCWEYHGNNQFYASCPHCLTKVSIVNKTHERHNNKHTQMPELNK